MKQHSTIKTAFAVLLSLSSFELYAQHHWAIAVLENGKEKPTIMEYHSVTETAENGIEYHRIFDDGYRFRNEAYNPVKLQYGYRWADKQMYIYDFENNEETLAFDFNLASGDHFTSFNGLEWEVETAGDTLVNMSFMGKGEKVTKKLLTVMTLDGTLSDQWLEDFGSLSGHFMINSMEDVECSQTLWVEYGMGEYLAREISTGPLQYMFPKDMLKYFEITNGEEEHTGKYDETKTEIVLLHVYLDERDLRGKEWHDLKPNGFTEPRVIQDFPLRELKVVLHVRRRRWQAEDGGNVILNRIPLAAEGTGYSAEFASFLKEALGYVPGDGPFRWSFLQDIRE